MTIPTHIIAGVVVGSITGNVPLAITVSIAPDLDHLISLAHHGGLRNIQTFFKMTTDREDPWGDQRGLLHNLLVYIGIIGVIYLLIPEYALIIGTSYGVHILLDAFDNSVYYPLYPSKRYSIRGPIAYYSRSELYFTSVVLFLFLAITVIY